MSSCCFVDSRIPGQPTLHRDDLVVRQVLPVRLLLLRQRAERVRRQLLLEVRQVLYSVHEVEVLVQLLHFAAAARLLRPRPLRRRLFRRHRRLFLGRLPRPNFEARLLGRVRLFRGGLQRLRARLALPKRSFPAERVARARRAEVGARAVALDLLFELLLDDFLFAVLVFADEDLDQRVDVKNQVVREDLDEEHGHQHVERQEPRVRKVVHVLEQTHHVVDVLGHVQEKEVGRDHLQVRGPGHPPRRLLALGQPRLFPAPLAQVQHQLADFRAEGVGQAEDEDQQHRQREVDALRKLEVVRARVDRVVERVEQLAGERTFRRPAQCPPAPG